MRLGRDHLRVVRAGLVLGAIGGCNYEGEQGRGSRDGGARDGGARGGARDRLIKGERGSKGQAYRESKGQAYRESKGQAYRGSKAREQGTGL